MNDFFANELGKDKITIFLNMSTFKVLITLASGYQIDFSKSGNFNDLLGFLKQKLVKSSISPNVPNITKSIDNLFLNCSLLSQSNLNGVRSNVLFSFATNTKIRSMPFEIIPQPDYFWHRIYENQITEIRFWFTDGFGNIIDLNGLSVSIMIVIRKMA